MKRLVSDVWLDSDWWRHERAVFLWMAMSFVTFRCGPFEDKLPVLANGEALFRRWWRQR